MAWVQFLLFHASKRNASKLYVFHASKLYSWFGRFAQSLGGRPSWMRATSPSCCLPCPLCWTALAASQPESWRHTTVNPFRPIVGALNEYAGDRDPHGTQVAETRRRMTETRMNNRPSRPRHARPTTRPRSGRASSRTRGRGGRHLDETGSP